MIYDRPPVLEDGRAREQQPNVAAAPPRSLLELFGPSIIVMIIIIIVIVRNANNNIIIIVVMVQYDSLINIIIIIMMIVIIMIDSFKDGAQQQAPRDIRRQRQRFDVARFSKENMGLTYFCKIATP